MAIAATGFVPHLETDSAKVPARSIPPRGPVIIKLRTVHGSEGCNFRVAPSRIRRCAEEHRCVTYRSSEYTIGKQKAPGSLQELVSEGYLRPSESGNGMAAKKPKEGARQAFRCSGRRLGGDGDQRLPCRRPGAREPRPRGSGSELEHVSKPPGVFKTRKRAEGDSTVNVWGMRRGNETNAPAALG